MVARGRRGPKLLVHVSQRDKHTDGAHRAHALIGESADERASGRARSPSARA